jgi:hypothetical protein
MNSQFEDIKKSIDNYITTVNALLCFISLTSWNSSKPTKQLFCSFGRNMTTSPQNLISPNGTITPDELIQLSTSLGIIIEVKIGLPQAKELWMDIERQLRKYDDNLIGWWTSDGIIPSWNSILLIEIARSEEFKEYHEKLISDGVFVASNNIIGIEFCRADQYNNYIFFRTRWGNIHDSGLGEILRLGKKKDIQDAEKYYGRIKFYDSPPEPEYLLSIIWQDIFTPWHRNVEYNKTLKCYPLDITISQLVDELQRSFGSKALQQNCGIHAFAEREVEYPQLSWIKDSLNILQKLGLAKQTSDDGYKVYFKRLRTADLIQYFSKARRKKEELAPTEKVQKSLFPDIES